MNNKFTAQVYEIKKTGGKEGLNLVTEITMGAGETVTGKIEYDESSVGTHNYKVVEKTEKADGYTYDTTVTPQNYLGKIVNF